MNKRRRETRRIKQGKPPKQVKRIKRKGILSSKKALFSELFLGLVSFLIGIYWAINFTSRYQSGAAINCHKNDTSCAATELTFAICFILAGLGTIIFVIMIAYEKPEK